MMIIPLKFNHSLARQPIVSIAIALLCVFFFWRQTVSEEQQIKRVEQYCQSTAWQSVLDLLQTTAPNAELCLSINMSLLQVYDEQQLRQMSASSTTEPEHDEEGNRTFTYPEAYELYRAVTQTVPRDLTFRMAQRSLDWIHPRVIFSQFAHGDIWHLGGNLAFFFAFCFAVENVIGPIKLIAMLLLCSAVDGVMFSFFSLLSGERNASLGLSGFVSAIMGALWYLLPWGRIKSLLFIPIPIIVNVPVWILSAFFFVWDVIALPEMFGDSPVNHLAHVSGCAVGFLLAWHWFKREKKWLRDAMDYELARSWHAQ